MAAGIDLIELLSVNDESYPRKDLCCCNLLLRLHAPRSARRCSRSMPSSSTAITGARHAIKSSTRSLEITRLVTLRTGYAVVWCSRCVTCLKHTGNYRSHRSTLQSREHRPFSTSRRSNLSKDETICFPWNISSTRSFPSGFFFGRPYPSFGVSPDCRGVTQQS
jgi:hypothetical protein